jgi:hypothetical protein
MVVMNPAERVFIAKDLLFGAIPGTCIASYQEV